MPEYSFGGHDHRWKCTAPNVNAAIRMFRISALFPATYATMPALGGEDEYRRYLVSGRAGDSIEVRGDRYYTDAKPGAVVRVYEGNTREPVAMIPVWDVAVEVETMAMLRQIPDFNAEAPTTTALAPRAAAPGRSSTETALVKLQTQLAELERQKYALQAQADAAMAAAKLQMQNVWLIELFIGSSESVIVLRDGAGSESDIHVYQRTYCMDEEIAEYAVFNDVEWSEHDRFDYQDVGAFDRWLLSDRQHLDQIIPAAKGVRALRVRRNEKARSADNLGEALSNAQEAQWDRQTHLYIRNGERLYRISIDVNLWPRLFMAAEDVPGEKKYDDDDSFARFRVERDTEEAKRKVKHYFAGLLALQGIIQRSDLLAPLSEPRPNILAPMPEGIVFVRDDEPLTQRLLTDAANEWLHTLTWQVYAKWLEGQLAVGVQVMLVKHIHLGSSPGSSHDSWEQRTHYTAGQWGESPPVKQIYTIEDKVKGLYGAQWDILIPRPRYRLGDSYAEGYDGDEENRQRPRRRRVRFSVYPEEIIPVDLVSARVLRYLIADRTHRSENVEAFWLMRRWFRRAEAERAAEKPFIDLVLVQAGADPHDDHERARAERLLRWWKLKVKEHRTIGTDEAKALRMIVAAFQRGDDHENDPEVLLMRAQRTAECTP